MTNNEKVATTASRIKEAMQVAGKKQADLMRETGLDRGAISSYISGKYEPKQKAINKLAVALDVSEMWLWGYDVPKTRTAVQKKNDQLVELIAKLRQDAEFLEVVTMLSCLHSDQYASVRSIILALGKK
jgi:transcriptional regulator with XRE-family HTH domain